MAQPVLLRLSPAEWMLSVMTVQPDAAASLAEAVNKTMTPERLQGALQAARDALLARDLGRLNVNGKLEINPVVRSCTRAVVSPCDYCLPEKTSDRGRIAATRFGAGRRLGCAALGRISGELAALPRESPTGKN